MFFVRGVNVGDVNGIVLDASVVVTMGFKFNSSAETAGLLSTVASVGFIGAYAAGTGR